MIEKTLDSPPISSCMTSPCDFQDYLQSLCTAYEQWWEENAFIEEIKDAWFEFVLDGKTKSNKSADEQRTTDEQRQEITKPVLRLIEDYRHQKILIVGDPGAGKSTLLKRLLRDAAEKAQKDEQAPIPVFVELKDYKTTGDRAGVRGLILESLESHDPALDEEALKQLLARKRLLLLTDGLNELSHEPAKAELKKLCLHQAIIATSRFANSWWDIDRKLEIQPLTPRQVKRFLEERLPNRDRAEVEKLGERVRDLGQTPLMVWMLYSIFQAKKETPTTRGEAYRSFTALYVEQAKTGLDLAESRFLLSRLAFEMMQSQKPDNPTHFSLDMTEVDAQNRLGSTKTLNQLLSLHLLQASGQPGNRKIRFCHQTLQEYYAAEALLEQLQNHPEWLEKTSKQQWTRFQQDYLNYVEWTEAIALMLGLPEVTTNQAKQLIELALGVDLLLGARLAGEVKTENQAKVIKLVEDRETTALIKISLLEKTRSSIAANGLKYALNCSEEDIRRRAAWALRKMPHDVVIPLAEIALKDVNYKVRENAIWALGDSKTERVIPMLNTVLERDLSANVRLRAMYALQEFGANEEAIIGLLKATRDSDRNVKGMAAYALEKIDRQMLITILAKVLSSESIILKVAAIKMLERLGTETVNPYLRRAILDPNQAVHLEAKNSLQSVINRIAFQVQRQMESARNDQETQWQREHEACIADLKAINPIQRGNAIQRLASLLGRDAIAVVIKTLDDTDGYVQFSACNILASRILRQFPEEVEALREAVPKLIEILNEDEEPRPHAEAASALGQLEDKNACACLSKAMSCEEPSTRLNALEALVKLGCQGVEVELLKALKDDTDYLVKSFAAKALGGIQCKESISELISSLENVDALVQSSICEALGQFQGDVASKYLPRLIELTATDVGEQALYAIAAIQSRCGFYNYKITQSSQSNLLNRETTPDALLDTINRTTHATYKKVIQMADQPKVQMNFHAPVENAIGNVEGNMVINATPPQDQEATTAISNLLNNLHQTYPNATDEEIYDILLRRFQAMPQKNPQNWQRWQDLLSVFFSGGIEATKVLVPIAGIPIEVLKRLYEVYDRNRLSGS